MKKTIRRAGFFLICIVLLTQTVFAAELIPVGEVIGIELADGTVTITGFDPATGDAAQQAGLQPGDRITRVDDRTVTCAQDVRQALERSDGTVNVTVLREGREQTFTVRPAITADGPKLGVYLKQGVTGIGTVTWYDPQTGQFGALGHGVNSPEGELLEMTQGKVYRATVVSVEKGKAGDPGQLVGSMEGELPVGTIRGNTQQGIFGTVPAGWEGKTLSTCPAEEIETGKAVILSTVRGREVQEYSVEIVKIYPNTENAQRNMVIKITDPALLEATGGIVQGMSGSPIIQNGKLVGAVTHVLVNDPTTGYGIFIENMLDAAI